MTMRRRILAVLLAAVAGGAASGSASAVVVPDQLTVGVALPSEGFQVGSVRGQDVVFARGYEIDLARALRAKLGLKQARFVQSPFPDLLTAGVKPWDVAIAQISVTAARRAIVDFSAAYMTVDQGVMLSRQVARAPRNIAELKGLKVCALTGSTGQAVVAQRVRPKPAVRLFKRVSFLMQSLQSGLCEAVVYDAPSLATLRARVPSRYGGFAGVLRTRESYAVALVKGSALTRQVNAALAALKADGTLRRLEKQWLAVDLSGLRALT
jgi:polar amino acid transport system substrate-binding protein